MTMYCPNCRTENLKHANFCRACRFDFQKRKENSIAIEVEKINEYDSSDTQYQYLQVGSYNMYISKPVPVWWNEFYQALNRDDNNEAFSVLDREASKGSHEANIALGDFYFHAWGTEKNLGKAIECWNSVAKLNHPEGKVRLGVAYINGYGVFEDEKKGLDLIKKAAKEGSHNARMKIVDYHLYNLISTETGTKLKEWIIEAEEAGFIQASLFMAGIYFSRNEVAKAIECLLKVAKSGNAFCKLAVEAIEDHMHNAEALPHLRPIIFIAAFNSFSNIEDFYVFPEIPDNKYKNVISQYQIIGAKDRPICIYDMTAFGTAKDGFAIFENGIGYKEMWEKPHFISLENIDLQSIQLNGKLLSFGYGNTIKVILDNKTMEEFISLLINILYYQKILFTSYL